VSAATIAEANGQLSAQAEDSKAAVEKLRAEIKRLQDVVPDQAHAMMSVASPSTSRKPIP
jgi:hypothetical protein